MSELNYDHILRKLEAAGGNVTATAAALDLPRSTLWAFLRRNGYFTKRDSAEEPAEEAASDSNDEENIRNARKEDARLLKAQAELRAERKKRKQAEADLDEAVERLQFYVLAGSGEYPQTSTKVTKKPVKGKSLDSATVVISCCDWHVGESVPPEEVGQLNAYSLDIAAARCDRLWEKVEEMIEHERQLADIREIVLWLGGDLISGVIHEELAETNEAGILSCLKFVQERVCEGLSILSNIKGIEQIFVPCSRGNHARQTAHVRHHRSDQHNFEDILFHTLALAHRHLSKIHFMVAPAPFLVTPIQNQTCRFTHGDLIRYHGGVLGVGVPIVKAIAKWDANQPADVTFLGHYHQATWHRKYIMSGSLVGFDQYAQSIGAQYEPPSQQLTVISQKRGVTKSYPLFLEA